MIALDPMTIEAIAQRTAELLRSQPQADSLIDADELARRFAVSREWVYEHANELGAIRLGDGERPRLRFDPASVAERFAIRQTPIAQPSRRTPRRRSADSTAALLPIRGER